MKSGRWRKSAALSYLWVLSDHLPDAVAVVHEEIFQAVPRFEQIVSPFSATWVLALSSILTVMELVWLSPVIWCITVV